jgi:hypothetical protein
MIEEKLFLFVIKIIVFVGHHVRTVVVHESSKATPSKR